MRGILTFMTAIAVSLGLLRFVNTANYSGDFLNTLLLIAAIIGAFMFGGAIGGLCGQLLTGTGDGVIKGISVGGFGTLCCCGVPYFLIMSL